MRVAVAIHHARLAGQATRFACASFSTCRDQQYRCGCDESANEVALANHSVSPSTVQTFGSSTWINGLNGGRTASKPHLSWHSPRGSTHIPPSALALRSVLSAH